MCLIFVFASTETYRRIDNKQQGKKFAAQSLLQTTSEILDKMFSLHVHYKGELRTQAGPQHLWLGLPYEFSS